MTSATYDKYEQSVAAVADAAYRLRRQMAQPEWIQASAFWM